MRFFLPILSFCLVAFGSFTAHGQALWRNFFSTNHNPIVEVVAGSNATVQATTPNVFTRRFTVNSIPSGTGTGQTNNVVVIQGTNTVVVTNTPAAGVTSYEVSAVPTPVYGSNVVGAVSESVHATNADTAVTATFVLTSTLTNHVYGTNVEGAVSEATHATNADSSVTATFVTTGTLTNKVSGANVVGAVAESAHATNADASVTSTFVTTGTLTNKVSGANVVGAVAESAHSTNSDSSVISTFVTTATLTNKVSGANVVGAVAESTHATNSDSSVTSTYVTTATLTNKVTGANVVGAVAESTHATNSDNSVTATFVSTGTLTNKVTGANVVGAVSESTHSTNSDNATSATTATTSTFVSTAILTNGMYASNVVSGGQIVSGGVETNQLDTGFLQLTGDKRKTTLDGSVLTNLTGANVTGTVPNATSSVNATNLYNTGLPVPTNTPTANDIIQATSGTSTAWGKRPLNHYTGVGSITINSAGPFYASAFFGGFGMGTTITTYSNTVAISSMVLSNTMFCMANSVSGTNVFFKLYTNGVASNISLLLSAGTTMAQDTSGATLSVPAGTSLMAAISHTNGSGSIGARTFLWGWAY